ncbi:hypothetical protein NW767_014600 [Fusarium falciforme]|nr:hypothetical protein NW767_014600 [Fusarium falciforme]
MGYFDVVQDEFRKAGILEDVEKESLRNTQGLKWRKPKDGGYLAELPGGPNPNQGPLQLGQHDVAKIILRHLEKYSHVEVNFGHTLKTLEQSEADGTVITGYSVDGKENTRSHTSRFLVGSDGGKSTARQLLGVRLEGFTWEDFQMAAVNIDYDLGAYGWAPGNAVVGDDVWAIVANIAEGTLWRVAYGISSAELDPEEPFDEEREQLRCRQKLAKILPGPTHQAEIKMLSLYQPRQMCATAFVQGRVALAGDSAHVSPASFLHPSTLVKDAGR